MRLVAALALALAAAGCTAGAPPPRPGACEPVEVTPDLGAEHLGPGETADYPSFPPSSGPHDPNSLRAGWYSRPLGREGGGAQTPTIYHAVHSLEHGYVVVFHRGLTPREAGELRLRFSRERKVIVVPEPELEGKLVLVAWRRRQVCRRFDPGAVEAFIRRFRETTAPEPGGP